MFSVEFLSVGGVSGLILERIDVSAPEIIACPAIPIGARICGSGMCQEAQASRLIPKTWENLWLAREANRERWRID
jgi:hypothetical protein